MKEKIIKILNGYNQNLEGYSYFGRVMGVSEDDFEEVAEDILKALKENEMIFTEQQRAEFLEAAKPMIKWLNENAPHPHCEVTVTTTDAEYKESSCMVKTEEFLKTDSR